MTSIQAKTITCPHCGHHTHIELDASNGDQNYYDECTNCCQELHLVTHLDEVKDKLTVVVDADDEQYY
ncbi:CPXCG motif-containing cysteine-rich protein [Psychrobium sp. 1_MG-2023]|uniref:CPXCG motif-containing cysteine-rich protein n=1 Tax=Psychrobium sp. 1_MG-2023 TaxID=3062624 RepID=UPI000C3335B3|nr:CPXCG motif-containing cysteine-rich protein [Psychrobium sp. 1_MG-2023]MDP2561668.1 CPXCG motif-containing cysteine-rich protein [Psychrobium sp. 1_MG-2023]PKF57073.1 CPXCG motif-containing cysteine-rich protein [Alteromonadales bacterium alter-6D02]